MKKSLIIIFILFINLCFSQQTNSVNWLTFKEVEKRYAKESKPILIDVYTEWCGWCKRMDVTTYKDPQIVSYLNSNFYCIKFDAEGVDTAIFNGKKYINPFGRPGRGTHHQFAAEYGINSYPTTLLFDRNRTQPLVYPGYAQANDLAPFLIYLNENLNNVTNPNVFVTDFKSAFEKPGKGNVLWKPVEEAFNSNLKNPKKILLNFYDESNITSKIMVEGVFKDSAIAAEINKNYYAINFNVASNESVKVFDTVLTKNPQYPYHNLVYGLLQKDISFPCIIIFDEKNGYVTKIPQFVDHVLMPDLLKFFSENHYKTMNFQQYQQKKSQNITK